MEIIQAYFLILLGVVYNRYLISNGEHMSQEIYNIFKCIQDLKMHTDVFNETLIVTSGGFDPLHVGHLR